ncbi:MAG TPA: NIL domain-containing protein [Allocoleopsis sp.]
MINTKDARLTEKRIRVKIPKHYHQEPVISHLISNYNITVNITAARLIGNAHSDGWFELNLQGKLTDIESALTYLNDLNLEIWNESEVDGW